MSLKTSKGRDECGIFLPGTLKLWKKNSSTTQDVLWYSWYGGTDSLLLTVHDVVFAWKMPCDLLSLYSNPAV